MALRRTLELLEAGERIADLMYRATVEGPHPPFGRRTVISAVDWPHLPGARAVARRRAAGFAIRHAGRRVSR